MNDTDNFEKLHRLIKKGDVISLREHLASGTDADTRNRYGWTPLMIAAGEGNTPIIEILLASGASVDALNDFSASPLAYAALSGECKAVQVLLDAGASVDIRPHGQSLLEFAGWGEGRFKTSRHFDILREAGAT